MSGRNKLQRKISSRADITPKSKRMRKSMSFLDMVRPSKLWRGIPSDRLDTHRRDILKLHKEFMDEEPSVDRILSSSISWKEKKNLIEDYVLYTHPHTSFSDRLSLRYNINKKIPNPPSLTEDDLDSDEDDWQSVEDHPIGDRLKGDHPTGIGDQREIERMRDHPIGDRLKGDHLIWVRPEHPREEPDEFPSHIEELDTTLSNKRTLTGYYRASKTNIVGREKYEWAMSLPYGKTLTPFPKVSDDTETYLCKVKSVLDSELYGLNKVKDEIISAIASRIVSNNSRVCVALCGPPGVGKTTIAEVMAKAVGFASGKVVPFQRICLGGVDDPTVLKGAEPHWHGSEPGIIVKTLKKMKVSDGIILFDEIDKIPDTERGRSVENALLHITDYTQNSSFNDHYFQDLAIDISRVWFIFSLNNEKGLSPAFRDRLNMIHVPPYKIEEVKIITKKYVLAKVLSAMNIPSEDVVMSEDGCTKIMELAKTTSKESRIREIERIVQKLINRLNVLRLCPTAKDKLDLSYSLSSAYITPFALTSSVVAQLLPDYNGNLTLDFVPSMYI